MENKIKNNDIKNEINQELDFNLQNVYEEEIFDVIKKLEDVTDSSSNYLSTFSNKFIQTNKIFTQDIKEYITSTALKYRDLFKLDDKVPKDKEKLNSSISLKMTTKKTIKLIKKLIEIYSQIFSSLKDNLKIFLEYLNISKSLNNPKIIEDFLSDKFNDIISCWLFMNINFEKFDFNEALNNCKFDTNFKNLLSHICKNKNFSMNIIYPKNPENTDEINKRKKADIKMISENKSNLVEFHIENAGNIDNFINNKFEFLKLKKLYMKNCTSKNTLLFQNMPNLKKFTLKLCPYIDVNILSKMPENIKRLYLEKNKFIDKDFYYILNNILLSNKNILQNLELLSFANNNLTKVDLSIIPSRYIFYSLIELNFKKNNIIKFNYSKANFKRLKFINCCNNNLNKSYLSEFETIIGLESQNNFLLDSKLSENYYNQLKSKLISNEKVPYRISYLNITFIPKIKSIEYFNNFNINENIMISLKKLDLSFNALNCDTFFKFIEKNKGFINLRSLKLNGNNLDDTFFEKYLKVDFIYKLEHLYLNKNNIGNPETKINYRDDIPIDENISGGNKDLVYKLRLTYNFLQNNIQLNKFSIANNPISKFYKTKNMDFDENMDEYIIKDEKNKIIINCFYSFLLKIKEEIILKEDEKGKKRNLNIIFDCGTNINLNSDNFPFNKRLIIYRK